MKQVQKGFTLIELMIVIAIIVAIAAANSPFAEQWHHLWHADFAITLGGATVDCCAFAGCGATGGAAAGFAAADWGKEFLPVQLRFANSRG